MKQVAREQEARQEGTQERQEKRNHEVVQTCRMTTPPDETREQGVNDPMGRRERRTDGRTCKEGDRE
jgi:hypothetical protein